MAHNTDAGDMLLRQWLILKIIPQYPRKTTINDIKRILEQEGFQMSRRTLERNLQTLSTIFPIISDESSRPYGWSWSKDAELIAIPTMSPLQALTLTLAKDHLTNLIPANLIKSIDPYFQFADNILLSGKHIKTMAQWRNKVAIASATQPLLAPAYTTEALDVVHEALMANKQIEAQYVSREKNTSKRHTLHPLGLVQRGMLMYLVATMYDYDDIRILALHRIRNAKLLEEKAKKPKGFNLKNYIDSGAFGFKGGEQIKLVARFKRRAAEHLRETPLSKDQKLKEDGDYIRIEATVANNDQLRWWLQGFFNDVEIIKPVSLRREFEAKVKELAATYK